jgi:hypothetical protein
MKPPPLVTEIGRASLVASPRKNTVGHWHNWSKGAPRFKSRKFRCYSTENLLFHTYRGVCSLQTQTQRWRRDIVSQSVGRSVGRSVSQSVGQSTLLHPYIQHTPTLSSQTALSNSESKTLHVVLPQSLFVLHGRPSFSSLTFWMSNISSNLTVCQGHTPRHT